jgi:hypothetical protein
MRTRARASVDKEIPAAEERGGKRRKPLSSERDAPRIPACFSLGQPRVHLCTSGYSYRHWHMPGSYYESVPAKKEFEFYAEEFNCLELNA